MFNYSSLLSSTIGRRVFALSEPTAGDLQQALKHFLDFGPAISAASEVFVKVRDSEFRVTGFTAIEERLPDGTFSTRIDLHLE